MPVSPKRRNRERVFTSPKPSGQGGLVAKWNAKSRPDPATLGQGIWDGVIQLAMDRAIDHDADEPRFGLREHPGI